MKEGYLQLKVRELEEKLKESEEKINKLLDNIQKKENEINELIKNITPRIEKAEEIMEEKREFGNQMQESLEITKRFHKKHYNHMYKQILKDLNKQLNKIKEGINYTIIDHTTQGFILLKLLQDKGIINPGEMLQYVEKYHDEIRDANLQEGMPQKNLEIREKK